MKASIKETIKKYFQFILYFISILILNNSLSFAAFSNTISSTDKVILPLRDVLVSRNLYFYKYNNTSDQTNYKSRTPGTDGSRSIYTGQLIYIDGNYFFNDNNSNNALIVGLVNTDAFTAAGSAPYYYKCIIDPNSTSNSSIAPGSINYIFNMYAPAEPGDYYLFISNRAITPNSASLSSLNTICNGQLSDSTNLIRASTFSSGSNTNVFPLTYYYSDYSQTFTSRVMATTYNTLTGKFTNPIKITVRARQCGATVAGNVTWGAVDAGTRTTNTNHVTYGASTNACSCGYFKGKASYMCDYTDSLGQSVDWVDYAGPSCYDGGGNLIAGCTSDPSLDPGCDQKCVSGSVSGGVNYPEMFSSQYMTYHAGSWDSTNYSQGTDPALGRVNVSSTSPCSGSFQILNKSVIVRCNHTCNASTSCSYTNGSKVCPTFWANAASKNGSASIANQNAPVSTDIGSCGTPSHYRDPVNQYNGNYTENGDFLYTPFTCPTCGSSNSPSPMRPNQYGIFQAFYNAKNPLGRGNTSSTQPNDCDRILTFVDLSYARGGTGNNVDFTNGTQNDIPSCGASGYAFWRGWHSGTIYINRVRGQTDAELSQGLANNFSAGALYSVFNKYSPQGVYENIFLVSREDLFSGYAVDYINSGAGTYYTNYLYNGPNQDAWSSFNYGKQCKIRFSGQTKNFGDVEFSGMKDTFLLQHLYNRSQYYDGSLHDPKINNKASNVFNTCFAGGCRYCGSWYYNNSPIQIIRGDPNYTEITVPVSYQSGSKGTPPFTVPDPNSANPCSSPWLDWDATWNNLTKSTSSSDRKIFIGDNNIELTIYRAYVFAVTKDGSNRNFFDHIPQYGSDYGNNWGWWNGSVVNQSNAVRSPIAGCSTVDYTNNAFVEKQKELEENVHNLMLGTFGW